MCDHKLAGRPRCSRTACASAPEARLATREGCKAYFSVLRYAITSARCLASARPENRVTFSSLNYPGSGGGNVHQMESIRYPCAWGLVHPWHAVDICRE